MPDNQKAHAPTATDAPIDSQKVLEHISISPICIQRHNRRRTRQSKIPGSWTEFITPAMFLISLSANHMYKKEVLKPLIAPALHLTYSSHEPKIFRNSRGVAVHSNRSSESCATVRTGRSSIPSTGSTSGRLPAGRMHFRKPMAAASRIRT